MVYFWFLLSFILILIIIGKNKTVLKLKNDLLNAESNPIEKHQTITEYIYIDSKSDLADQSPTYNIKSKNFYGFVKSKFLYPIKNYDGDKHYFTGKKVIITGDFELFPFRSEMAKMLWEVGADVDTGVGKTADVLIMGEDYGWSKLEKAKKQGVELIKEEDFIKYFPDYEPIFE